MFTLPNPKLLSLNAAEVRRNEFKMAGKKVVLTNGVFDLLHTGHLFYLQQARALGDALVIALNSDASVRALKGPTRPIQSETERAYALAALTCVDAVVIFRELRLTREVLALRPDVYCKAGDYTLEKLNPEERGALESVGARIEFLPFLAGFSTTNLVARIKAGRRDLIFMRVVLIGSGRGSNAEAILQAQQEKKLGRAEVVQIFSDRPDAGILALGPRFGVPATFMDPAPFKTKLDGEAEQHYIASILACAPDLIVLAGFMRVLKLPFLSKFEGMIINLHPSLLPSFPGLDGIGQAFRRGVKVTGCTVHYVTAEVDGGPILDQATVRVDEDDTLESLSAKVHAAEHQLLPAVIARLSRL